MNSQHKHTSVKPPIPKRDEKPIMGLKTKKNFILANAVENMLACKYDLMCVCEGKYVRE